MSDRIAHVTGVIEAINARRWDDVVAGYAPEATIDYVHSGAQVVGREAMHTMLQSFETPPTFVVRNAFAGDDAAVIVEFDAVYGGTDPWKGVALYWLTDAGIAREVVYFVEPVPPSA